MKKTFIVFMYNSGAVEATGGEQTNVSNEKTKLELLQEAGLAIWEKLKTVDFGSKEANDLQLDLFKNKNEIAAEQKRLENEKREQEAKLLREQKLQELRNLCTLAVENDKVASDKKASEEEKNAAKMALDAQFEKIANIVLGGKTEKPATSSNGETVKRGGISEAIIAEYEKHIANGCTDTEARKKTIEAGFSRGTVGSAVFAYLNPKA